MNTDGMWIFGIAIGVLEWGSARFGQNLCCYRVFTVDLLSHMYV